MHRPDMTEMKCVLVKCACRLRLEERRVILNTTQSWDAFGHRWQMGPMLNLTRSVMFLFSRRWTSLISKNLWKAWAEVSSPSLLLRYDISISETIHSSQNCVWKCYAMSSSFAARMAEAADDGDGSLNSARTLIEDLVLAGYTLLMRTLRTLILATDPYPAKMHEVLPAAFHFGLIADILLCAHRYSPLPRKLRANLMSILRHLCQSTVCAEILATINDRMLETLAKCNKKGVKDEFQMFSQCKHSYYCSKECQSADWGAGEHKAACVAYRSSEHSSTQRRHLTTHDRDFMRALMGHDWRKSKGEIYKQMAECTKAHPDTGCFTAFDYVSGPFTAKV
ncbi:hypothetical protein B0H14DRAFT_1624687 [Mycena olivaceomarginata]|nr:hypothetical protein B0H14DRAFT_1624687 [Mycena olivaceomarginata]